MKYRTTQVNKAIPLICRKNKVFEDKKGGKHIEKSTLSPRVELIGNVSNHFCEDLVDTYLRIIHKK